MKEDLDTYKQAVWDFLMEHSEITERGSIFVKFHTSDRFDFEKRVRARWKYNYHREDVREKEAVANGMRIEAIETKKKKKEEYILDKELRRQALEKIKRVNERRAKWQRFKDKLKIWRLL